jgi:hypothetical protein
VRFTSALLVGWVPDYVGKGCRILIRLVRAALSSALVIKLRNNYFMKRSLLLFGCAALSLALLAGYGFSKSKKHEVIYKVHGKAGSKFVNIKYLDTPAYGYFEGKQLKRVRISAKSLPWTKTVYLPTKATTYVSVSNEQGRKSALRINVSVDKNEMRAWPSQDVEEFSNVRIIYPRR